MSASVSPDRRDPQYLDCEAIVQCQRVGHLLRSAPPSNNLRRNQKAIAEGCAKVHREASLFGWQEKVRFQTVGPGKQLGTTRREHLQRGISQDLWQLDGKDSKENKQQIYDGEDDYNLFRQAKMEIDGQGVKSGDEED